MPLYRLSYICVWPPRMPPGGRVGGFSLDHTHRIHRPYCHLCTNCKPRQWTKFHGYSEIQCRTVLSGKYFCDHRFEDPAASFSATPWAAKRAGKMCGNSYTPVPARARRFSGTPGPLVRRQSAVPHPCAAQLPAIPARSGRNRIAPRRRAAYCIPARRHCTRATVAHPCRIAAK